MIPYIKGQVAAQAHVGLPEGTYEEEYARGGFFGRYAHIYRKHPPVGWLRIEGPLRPRAFQLTELRGGGAPTFFERRAPLFSNTDLEICWTRLELFLTPFCRDADADTLFFVHKGKGKLETDFGPIFAEAGDYIVIPRGTVFRWHPQTPLRLLHLRSFSEIGFPEKGMLGQHALFDPAVIRTPEPDFNSPNPDVKEYEVQILRCGQITTVVYPFHPLEIVGWKGTLTPWQINVRDIRPVSSDRYHLPPSAHTTFVAQGFVVCTFLPRPLENGDPHAVKVPFYHSNIDYDELLFYHSGEFFSRSDVGPGMLTFHPQGIHHGPQPGAVDRTQKQHATNEVAVMIDTRKPLLAQPEINACENPHYWKSWQARNSK